MNPGSNRTCRPRVHRRVARAVTLVLVFAGLCQIVVAAAVIQGEAAPIRAKTIAFGLEILRPAVAAGVLRPRALADVVAGMPGVVISTWDADGVLVERAGELVDAEPRIAADVRARADARPGEPVFPSSNVFGRDNAALVRLDIRAPQLESCVVLVDDRESGKPPIVIRVVEGAHTVRLQCPNGRTTTPTGEPLLQRVQVLPNLPPLIFR